MIGREGIKTSLPASYKEIFFGFQVLRALCICLRARSRNRRLGAHSNINRKSVPTLAKDSWPPTRWRRKQWEKTFLPRRI